MNMTRMEKYKDKRNAINLENCKISSTLKSLQRQIDAMDDEMVELEDCIQELYEKIEELENKNNGRINDVMINGKSVCGHSNDCCKADHRKQRGRTAPNRALHSKDEVIDLIKEVEDMLKLFSL